MSLPWAEVRPLVSEPLIAHRGLWSPEGAPENSLAAFRAARDSGFGVELDVRLSADGEPVVFHDAELARMTGEAGRLADRSAAELAELRLKETGEPIPTLRQALEAIGPERLVLVECKTPFGQEGQLEAAVAHVLDAHPGPAAVIGFNPMTHAWFAEHRPEVPRGLNAYAYADESARGLAEEQRTALASFALVGLAQAQFILPGLDILESEPVARLRAEGLPVVAWTVRTPEQRARAGAYADNFIFEGGALA